MRIENAQHCKKHVKLYATMRDQLISHIYLWSYLLQDPYNSYLNIRKEEEEKEMQMQ